MCQLDLFILKQLLRCCGPRRNLQKNSTIWLQGRAYVCPCLFRPRINSARPLSSLKNVPIFNYAVLFWGNCCNLVEGRKGGVRAADSHCSIQVTEFLPPPQTGMGHLDQRPLVLSCLLSSFFPMYGANLGRWHRFMWTLCRGSNIRFPRTRWRGSYFFFSERNRRLWVGSLLLLVKPSCWTEVLWKTQNGCMPWHLALLWVQEQCSQ